MRSTVKMHSVMMTTNPPLFYWNHITFEIIELIRELISEKFKVFFTIDAGPQVKIITLKENEEIVLSRLREISQIEQIIVCKIGNGAEIIKEGN
jgi:diphosphomevalonate decarboxylase